MPANYIWVERKFKFELPAWMYANTVSRVRGGPARAEDLVRNTPQSILIARQGESWSIQEHLGHLVDLESLWTKRLDELVSGATHLTAWEESNRETYEANHNSRSLEVILKEFRENRSMLVDRLDNIDSSLIERTALHPRLNTPMRLIDLVYFIAEHDDHHLAEVARLQKEFKSN